jgi:hypothetical protein
MSGKISKYDLSTHSGCFRCACTHTEYLLNIAVSVHVKLLGESLFLNMSFNDAIWKAFVLSVTQKWVNGWTGEFTEWYWGKQAEVLGENSDLVPLCRPECSHGLARNRTRVSAVRGRWLTTCPWHALRNAKCYFFEFDTNEFHEKNHKPRRLLTWSHKCTFNTKMYIHVHLTWRPIHWYISVSIFRL